MKIVKFDNKIHYDIITEWWEKQEWPILPLDALPTTGFIAYEEELPVAAGFLYNTDSSFAILEWIVGNPDIDHEIRSEGLDFVIEGLILMAKVNGKKFINTQVEHKRLIKRYEKFDFKKTDTNVTVMIRSL